jgi:hypothetical protein
MNPALHIPSTNRHREGAFYNPTTCLLLHREAEVLAHADQ